MSEDRLSDLIGSVDYKSEKIYITFGQYFMTSVDGGVEFEVLKSDDVKNLHPYVFNTRIKIRGI